ncbi:MAG: LysM peptidoglycan-binding domain-containing protein [Anaerolineae bacterium]|jgi:LysM repeat protein|nr:LysM peptidoglycan-binding domain-containing protein [Anaerolineae bacterium]
MLRSARLITVFILLLAVGLVVHAQDNTPATHTVAPGETLASIAARYELGWQDLARVNNIVNPNLIYVGQTLTLPTDSDTGTGGIGTPPENGATPGTVVRYVVRPADTLSELAVEYCTTVVAIANASGVNRYSRIFPGQALTIPVGTCTVGGPVYGYPPHDRPATGGIGNPYIPPAPATRYVVRYGDTLFRIGARYGVNIYRIAEANGILNLNAIYAGQPLVIPSR